ncbi:MAG TPA: D-aminoacyl-tRNA deacylase [Gaiellaceae bacterium]|nr:D-aminoacyl-tRNA deacylase [Gaiellaceae bacterium]
MRAVCQRVSEARVTVAGAITGEIGAGLAVFVGIERSDEVGDARELARKVARLRIFEDDRGKFARSLIETSGSALVVSQFTLVADTRKGNRPSFTKAAPPEQAEPLYEEFCAALAAEGVPVETGVFGARMAVELVNDGPVTIVIG